MTAQSRYWLKYKNGNTESVFRCNETSEMENFVIEYNIQDSDIIEIIKWI